MIAVASKGIGPAAENRYCPMKLERRDTTGIEDIQQGRSAFSANCPGNTLL
jgi:hypothetical protein